MVETQGPTPGWRHTLSLSLSPSGKTRGHITAKCNIFEFLPLHVLNPLTYPYPGKKKEIHIFLLKGSWSVKVIQSELPGKRFYGEKGRWKRENQRHSQGWEEGYVNNSSSVWRLTAGLWLPCRGGEAGHVRGLARALELQVRQERRCVWGQLWTQ